MFIIHQQSLSSQVPELTHVSEDRKGAKKVYEPPKQLKWLRNLIPAAEGLSLKIPNQHRGIKPCQFSAVF